MKPVTLPLPLKGLNLDAHPGALSPDESPMLANVLLNYGPQLERRGPYQVVASDNDTNKFHVPVGVVRHGKKLLMSLLTDAGTPGTAYPYDYSPRYRNDPLNVNGIEAGTSEYENVGMVWLDGTTLLDPASNINAGSLTAESCMPFTRGAGYEGVTYYTSIETEATAVKVGANADTPGTTTRLCQWAGSNQPGSTLTTSADATVGSTTVDLGANFGNNPVNMFLAFSPDVTTAGADFSYLIVEHLAGNTYRIAKPYGLGSATAVSRVNQTAWLLPRFVIQQSPPAATCVAVHLDRLFVGRPWLTNSTGTLQRGYWPSGIAWSEVSNPEKWPDQNIAVVGSEANDQVMGLQSLGRHLIIFKRYSTWVMAGDSEENFVIKRLIGNVGCIDDRGIVEHNDSVIFPSEQGIFRINQNLEVDELTQRETGHGIKQDFRKIWKSGTERWHQCTMTVDKNDYLHVNATNDLQVAQNDGVADNVDSPHSLMNPSQYSFDDRHAAYPKSCYLPKKHWVTLQSNFHDTSLAVRYAVNPRFYISDSSSQKTQAVGIQTVIDLDYVAQPVPNGVYGQITTPFFFSDGYDTVANNADGTKDEPFFVDVLWADLELVDNSTWAPLAVTLKHCIEYQSTDVDDVNSTQLAMEFDPVGESVMKRVPGMVFGTLITRFNASSSPNAGETTYVKRIVPTNLGPIDFPSTNQVLRGNTMRFRIFETPGLDNQPVNHWRLFKVVVEVEPGRVGRETEPLL